MSAVRIPILACSSVSMSAYGSSEVVPIASIRASSRICRYCSLSARNWSRISSANWPWSPLLSSSNSSSYITQSPCWSCSRHSQSVSSCSSDLFEKWSFVIFMKSSLGSLPMTLPPTAKSALLSSSLYFSIISIWSR